MVVLSPKTYRAVFVSLLLVVSTVSVVGAGAAQSTTTELKWDNGGSNGGGSPVTFYEDIDGTLPTPVEFGPEAVGGIRVENVDTGDQLTLEPSADESSYTVDGFSIDTGEIRDSLGLNLQTADGEPVFNYAVEYSGNEDIFEEATFGTYQVALLDTDGTVIAETDETRTRGHGYVTADTPFKYDGSTLAVARDPAVESDWVAVLEQDSEQVTTMQAVNNGDRFVADTAGTEFNISKSFDVDIYPSEESVGEGDRRIISLYKFGPELDPNNEDVAFVDNIEGDDEADSSDGTDSDDGATDDNSSGDDSATDGDSNQGSDDNGKTVEKNGSVITLPVADGAASAAIEGVPSNTTVSELSGVGQAQPGGAIWNGPQGETVSFNLTPASGIAVGDTIELNFYNGSETRTISVEVIEEPDTPNVEPPEGFNADNAKEIAGAVAGDDGEITPISIAQSISENQQEGNVDGVEVTPIEFAQLISANAER